LAIGLATAGGAAAQSRWSLGTQIGSTGIGGEVGFMASPHFTLRGDYDYLRYDGEVHGDTLTYKGHFHMSVGGLFGDWHPWASNGFLVTAGAYIGAREAGGGAGLQVINNIGGQTFTLDQVRGVKATAKLDEFAPTIGLGYNNTFLHKHWGFKAIAGVVFSEQPRAKLSLVNGTLDPATQQRLQAAVEAEQDKISNRLTILKTYPLFELGVAYRF
jgi:hypothetical protein